MNKLQERISSSFKAQGLMTTLAADLALIEDGEVHISLPFAKQLSQQHGYMHAVAITSIVDTACWYAALTKAPANCEVVTAEFKINFLRTALGGASWPSEGFKMQASSALFAAGRFVHTLGTTHRTGWSR